LDRWLATQARQSMDTRDAVTYLLLDEDRIVGYYSLSAGQVSKQAAPARLGKGAPDPIPVVRMGRLAVDRQYQRQQWGAELLREALQSAVAAIELVGARAILVDAINDAAAAFYRRFGFVASPVNPMQLMYDLRVVEASLQLPK
jgi:ribosomal protein S18 acetylase RimI-like enzyme